MKRSFVRKTIVFIGFFMMILNGIKAQPHLNIIREEIRIPLRDGIQLSAILYRPDSNEKFPALVYRTPYGALDYDSYAEFQLKAAKRGFLVFLVDVRGRYGSEGNFEAYKNEGKDGYDVIEWVGNHPFCSGKVGTYGGSYPGIVQWQAMAELPPHLKAAAPEMTPIGSHHFFYHGGAFSHSWLDWFVPYIFADKRKKAGDTSGTWDDLQATEEWESSDRRRWYHFRPLIDLPILKEYAPEYYQWLLHPDKSEWWDFVDTEDDFKNFTAPVLLLSGWYDAAYGPEGATRAFNKIQKEASGNAQEHSHLVLGPWNHTTITPRKTKFGEIDFLPSAGMDYDEMLLDWFEEQLKGISNPRPYPPVSIFVMGANRWRAEKEWPLSRALESSWYLQSLGQVQMDNQEGKLSTILGPDTSSDRYVFDPKEPFWDKFYEKSIPYDQRENENRKDVLVFTSEPLEEDTEVTGEVILELFVSSSAKDTDFAFTLSDVYPDGKSINVTGLDAGYLRMRYRNGYEKQELMTPGQVYKIRIGDVYTSNLFKKGHQIRIAITSSKAPHYDPNPNTGTVIAEEKNGIPAINVVYNGKNYPSRVILPIVE